MDQQQQQAAQQGEEEEEMKGGDAARSVAVLLDPLPDETTCDDPSPLTASSPSPPLPTFTTPRLPAPLVLHTFLPPRAAAVDAPLAILLPCKVAAAPRLPLTCFAPRLDSWPIGELRSKQHIWSQPRRVHW